MYFCTGIVSFVLWFLPLTKEMKSGKKQIKTCNKGLSIYGLESISNQIGQDCSDSMIYDSMKNKSSEKEASQHQYLDYQCTSHVTSMLNFSLI